ncbi:MAG TPA: flagellar biosynthetic protein FliO [Rhodocyclaceae bacterium]|nr:flagellar biosynthetic protein FliO [Rhodocyclaceae bacterium]HNA03047.1 flagellar biosynthetic protein FliO [Rhodocyclaceae bacterium]HNH13714.1 flagellar biosynthetic protein FliO [Rhodocyclaceae bacterium]HNH97781.1 flagellar biosynthetic protein FliO [Rhodocyclaceae bacterium]
MKERLALRLVPSLFAAAAPVLARAQVAPEVGPGLLQMLLGLVFVIGLILASLWVLKRLTAPRGTAAQMLRIVAGQAVGARERVVIVEIGETALVLGVAPGHISTLHTMPRSELPQAPAPAAMPAAQFAARLKQIMEKRNAPPA